MIHPLAVQWWWLVGQAWSQLLESKTNSVCNIKGWQLTSWSLKSGLKSKICRPSHLLFLLISPLWQRWTTEDSIQRSASKYENVQVRAYTWSQRKNRGNDCSFLLVPASWVEPFHQHIHLLEKNRELLKHLTEKTILQCFLHRFHHQVRSIGFICRNLKANCWGNTADSDIWYCWYHSGIDATCINANGKVVGHWGEDNWFQCHGQRFARMWISWKIRWNPDNSFTAVALCPDNVKRCEDCVTPITFHLAIYQTQFCPYVKGVLQAFPLWRGDFLWSLVSLSSSVLERICLNFGAYCSLGQLLQHFGGIDDGDVSSCESLKNLGVQDLSDSSI